METDTPTPPRSAADSTLLRRIDSLARGILLELDRLVFPRACAWCSAHAQRVGLCEICRAEIVETATRASQCARCANQIESATPAEPSTSLTSCRGCARRRYAFESALALARYEGPVRALCIALKQRAAAWLAGPLVDLCLDARETQIGAWIQTCRAESNPPVVVPVPNHWTRRLTTRSHDQAQALAECWVSRLKLPLARAVARVRKTKKLAPLAPRERVAALRRAFAPHPREARAIAGRPVILVDDILTTGATCHAVTRALKRAGATRVLALVIGRATEPRS